MGLPSAEKLKARNGVTSMSSSQVDRSALKYLQQTLGPQSVAVAAQAYQDPRVTDSAKKEPLARLALNFVGPDRQANEFYQRAINDPVLTARHRKNLIEDLNQDGFPDTRNLSERVSAPAPNGVSRFYRARRLP